MLHPSDIRFEEISNGTRLTMIATYRDLVHEAEVGDVYGTREAVNGYRFYLAQTLGNELLDEYVQREHFRVKRTGRRRTKRDIEAGVDLMMVRPDEISDMHQEFGEYNWYLSIGEL